MSLRWPEPVFCVMIMFLIPDFSRNDLTDFYELKSILTIRATRCTKCWSNIALKCYANTFVKVDAQILDICRRTIPYLKGYSYPKLHCKKLSNQEPMVNTVGTTRRTTLCCCGLRLNNFYSSNLLSINVPFIPRQILTKRNTAATKH